MNIHRNSAWTGRAPRSMSEAFNAHVDNTLEPMRDDRDYSVGWYAWMAAIAAVTFVLIWTTR